MAFLDHANPQDRHQSVDRVIRTKFGSGLVMCIVIIVLAVGVPLGIPRSSSSSSSTGETSLLRQRAQVIITLAPLTSMMDSDTQEIYSSICGQFFADQISTTATLKNMSASLVSQSLLNGSDVSLQTILEVMGDRVVRISTYVLESETLVQAVNPNSVTPGSRCLLCRSHNCQCGCDSSLRGY